MKIKIALTTSVILNLFLALSLAGPWIFQRVENNYHRDFTGFVFSQVIRNIESGKADELPPVLAPLTEEPTYADLFAAYNRLRQSGAAPAPEGR